MSNKSALKGLVMGMAVPLVLAGFVWLLMAHPGTVTANTNSTNASILSNNQAFTGGSPLVIPAAAFNSDGIDPTNYGFWFSTGAIEGIDSPASGDSPCLKAPVYLPQWAEVYQFWASIYDNDASNNVLVTLRRVHNGTGVVTTMASVSSSGASTDMQSVGDYSITDESISYPNYSYYATVCLYESDTKLYSVRIWYEEQNIFLPILLRN